MRLLESIIVRRTLGASIILTVPFLGLTSTTYASVPAGSIASCIASQIKTTGRWSFLYPKKGNVGGRLNVDATIELSNLKSRACAFRRDWPKVTLFDGDESMLRVHEQEIDGQDAVGTPILPPKGTHSGDILSVKWINWCGSAPALPIHIGYRIVPTRTSLILTPRLKPGRHFHMPGCINSTVPSVVEVVPYLAISSQATR